MDSYSTKLSLMFILTNNYDWHILRTKKVKVDGGAYNSLFLSLLSL